MKAKTNSGSTSASELQRAAATVIVRIADFLADPMRRSLFRRSRSSSEVEVVVVLRGCAGAPRSDCGTFGAGFDSRSQPTANAPTQIERINANGLRMVSNPLRMFDPNASRIQKICEPWPITGSHGLARQGYPGQSEQSVGRGVWRAYSRILVVPAATSVPCSAGPPAPPKTCGFVQRGPHLGVCGGIRVRTGPVPLCQQYDWI